MKISSSIGGLLIKDVMMKIIKKFSKITLAILLLNITVLVVILSDFASKADQPNFLATPLQTKTKDINLNKKVLGVSTEKKSPLSKLFDIILKPMGIVVSHSLQTIKPTDLPATDPLNLTNIGYNIKIDNLKNKTIIDNLKTKTIEILGSVYLKTYTNNGIGCILVTDQTGKLICDTEMVKKVSEAAAISVVKNLNFTPATPETAKNIFKTIIISGQPSIIADDVEDTLNILAGSGISLSTNASTDTITISSTGGGGGGDAATLDSLDSTQFLRSDASDNFTSGTLTFDAGTTLSIAGSFVCTNCVGDAAVVDSLTVAAAGITGTLSDAQVSNALTVDASGSLNATAINSGTLGNPSVTLAFGSFGAITGSLGDSNVADTLTINSSSSVDWTALNSYPAACAAGTAVTALADSPTCSAFLTSVTFADIGSGTNTNSLLIGTGGSLGVTGTGTITATNLAATSSVVADAEVDDNITVDWSGLQNYPAACSANNAITALGDSPTCAAFWNTGNDGPGSGLDADTLDGSDSSAFSPVAGSSSITTVGTLNSGSITTGFGAIDVGTDNITGATINGTTGINTGTGAGTQRIDASGNLVNITSITGSDALTISSANSAGLTLDSASGTVSLASSDKLSITNNTSSIPGPGILVDWLTGSAGFVGVDAQINIATTADIVGTVVGVRSFADNNFATGAVRTIDAYYNFQSQFTTYDWFINTGMVFTKYAGLYISDPDLANTNGTDTTITNPYGIYIEDFTPDEGTFTNTPVAIYQAGTNDYNILGGFTKIGGTTNPTAALDVAGSIQLTGTISDSDSQVDINDDLDVAGHGAFGSSAVVLTYSTLNLNESFSSESSGLNITIGSNAAGTAGNYNGIDVLSFTASDAGAADVRGIRIRWGAIGNAVASNNAWGILVDTPFLSGPTNPATAYGMQIVNQGFTGTTNVYGIMIEDQLNATNQYAIYTVGANDLVYFGGKVIASGGSTSAVGFNLNTAQAAPTCASLANGDFGFDSTNNRIFWKGTAGTCSYWNRTGTFDIAERAPASEDTEEGDVLVIDTSASSFAVKKSTKPYEQGLIAIESTDPTFIDNPDSLAGSRYLAKLALAGRVPTKVSTENGPIKPGDPLTSSSIPGVAMKAKQSGPIVGKALESFTCSGVEPLCVGKIMVFVSIGWYIAGTEENPPNLADIAIDRFSIGTLNSQLLIVGERKISMDKTGRLKIDGDVQVDGTIFTQKIQTDEVSVGDKSSGTGKILAGTKETKIYTSVVSTKAKIFITFNNDYSPASRYWVTKEPGASFTLHLDQPISSDTTFDWLIIN